MNQFERNFNEVFMGSAPLNELELQTERDYRRGKQRAAALLEAEEGQSQAYNEGYGDEYAYQMSVQGRLREV